jgi:polyvinyl alcohol dehydrogenase (cytochrome)
LVRTITKIGYLQASPTVVGGVAYQGSNNGYLYAINISTGAISWKQYLGKTPNLTAGCGSLGITSTATVAPDPVTGALTVYDAGGDGYMYALNASTGAVIWRSVVGVLPTTQNGYYNWSSPALIGGHVYIGMSSQCETTSAGFVRGGIEEFDQQSGALLNTWWGVPDGATGGGVFTSVASDATNIWATTASAPALPAPQGDSYSMVRFDLNLAKQESWQVPAASRGADADFGASPTLFTATLSGSSTQMVGACDKNGFFYAFRATNVAAGYVWRTKIGIGQGINAAKACLDAAVWDGSHLFVGGPTTTINGVTYKGSIAQLDPATGSVLWRTGLPSNVLGSPSADGSGVIAAATYNPTTGATNATYLLNATNGNILATLQTGDSEFPQPVFAGTFLLLATHTKGLEIWSP